ncbi:hypothetical protein ACFRQM_44955 [Streptomyces sp. NPDC056831]|uniref:hypothetical protein n=1 Tax=Streptomyces sp. NPDC056831 TaxID=3345954 RepID=UPI0036B6799D
MRGTPCDSLYTLLNVDGGVKPEMVKLEAMTAAQACSAGHQLLPLPEHGRPYDLPPVPPGAAALVPHVRLLRLVQAALDRVAATEAGGGTGCSGAGCRACEVRRRRPAAVRAQ